MPKSLSPAEAQTILESGRLDELVGAVEDDRLECKKAPYQLGQDAGKMELVKDVSGLANAGGGLILIGCRTEKDPTVFGDVLRHVSPFGQGLIDPQDYQNVIRDWVYPALQVKIRWFSSAADPAKGIVAIHVPEEAVQNRPFLVTKTAEETGKLRGTLFGFFERRRDTVPAMSVQELRDRLKDGLRFSDLDRRLQNIEETLGQLSLSQQRGPSISPDELRKRIPEARLAVGLQGKPSLVLAAVPVQPVQFPALFWRDSEVVRLLEHPPKLRNDGFDLNTYSRSEIVRGLLRRCISPGDKLLELWRDGLLVFVGSGDADFLAWAQEDTSRGLRINTWVLVECTYLFANLAIEMARHSQPEAARMAFSLLLEDMNVGGAPCRLGRSARKNYMESGRTAPDGPVHVTVECEIASATSGSLAYSLLTELYIWFGFDTDSVPLADRGKTPPVIDPDFITGKR